MPDQVRQVAARDQRSKLSSFALVLFEETTNDGLKSMMVDDRLSDELRAFAHWELEFREAFSTYVDFDPAGQIRRTKYETEAQARELLSRTEREQSERRQRVADFKLRAKNLAAPMPVPAPVGSR